MFIKMKKRLVCHLLMAAALLLAGGAQAQVAGQDTGAKQLWQLIDYVAVDYSGAVEHGKVVSEAEYAEMLDFTDNATTQIAALPAHASKATIAAAIADLRKAVVAKADGAEVKRLAHHANGLLIAAYPIPVAPKVLPNLARGAALYAAQCASCHGVAGGGDGPLAASLEPKPIAFTDGERAQSRSLMALYQVISQGVAGTSMASFGQLSEEERWDLAFYIGGMSHDAAAGARGEKLWQDDPRSKKLYADLAAVTTLTQEAAAAKLGADEAQALTAYLRSHPDKAEAHKPAGLALSRLRLAESLAAMHAGDRAGATRLGLSAYLDGFEPIEPMVGARNKSLLLAVENAMLAYRSAVAKGTVADADAAGEKLQQLFTHVEAELGDAKADPMTTFIGALTILLREGVEALLIVIGIIAFLRKAKRNDVLPYVHAGWASALVAGGLTWVAATYLVTISGASREVSEGLGSVFAALVLLSVGLWMHQKSSAGRWQEYLHEKLTAAMSRRSAWGLFALAFIAVYREVFETVLFYSALAADGNGGALLGGFLVAIVLLVVIAWALLRTSARMPIGKFFSWTSAFVAVLAVILMGKGVAALQEAGWVGVSPVDFIRVDLLGILPTLETLLAQAAILAIIVAGYGWNRFSAGKHKLA
ncbi:cytochrome c/FTR1 family iron permease [Janthinobacterium sp. 1_2014MBL_MicDiv]|uniref:cytochrome c/FTR1 family iron permease n=1 Tax=Janthinobacterium sp. 1_2014MBL_MicDiv TaxID=1644131 RepID=UPI000B2416C4|nr:cytochrome c/FTR1 family iron permease [Janthinobacterium sp. 1_2014MBL_MicDiv]